MYLDLIYRKGNFPGTPFSETFSHRWENQVSRASNIMRLLIISAQTGRVPYESGINIAYKSEMKTSFWKSGTPVPVSKLLYFQLGITDTVINTSTSVWCSHQSQWQFVLANISVELLHNITMTYMVLWYTVLKNTDQCILGYKKTFLETPSILTLFMCVCVIEIMSNYYFLILCIGSAHLAYHVHKSGCKTSIFLILCWIWVVTFMP